MEPRTPEFDREDEFTPIREEEMVKAFYFAYRTFCRLVRAEIETNEADFRDAGKAWFTVARRFRYARVILNSLGPLTSTLELFDKFNTAWAIRRRFIPKGEAAERELSSPVGRILGGLLKKQQTSTGQEGVEVPGQSAHGPNKAS